MTHPLLRPLELKALKRAGWVARAIPEPESVASHSWNLSLLVMIMLPAEWDLALALQYAVLHDLPEIDVGDITPADGISAHEKSKREHAAMVQICESLPRGQALLNCWLDYEKRESKEAKFVKELDLLEMALQATAYAEQHGADLSEFITSAQKGITHHTIKAVLMEITRDSV